MLIENCIQVLTTVQPYANTTYKLNFTDGFGCKDSTLVNVNLHLDGYVDAGRDQLINLGESAFLNATGDQGSIIWTPSSTLSCDTCKITQALPQSTTEYVMELIDTNGCAAFDSVTIEIAGIIWLPNTFTPNGDGVNDKFGAVYENIVTYHLEIYNRWGELIFESYDIDNHWDGTYKGTLSQIDSYVWRVTYSHLTQKQKILTGHVNLVR